jgi:hypothetical protein
MKGKMNLQKSVIIGILIAFSATVKADTIYSYTGNDSIVQGIQGTLYTTSDSVTGSFTTSVPLADDLSLATITPFSFSFTDGVQTITNLTNTSPDAFSYISTDSSGNIIQWAIDLETATGTNYIVTEYVQGFSTEDGGRYRFNLGENQGPEGDWSSVPEPSGCVLMSTALLGLALLARKRKFQLIASSPHSRQFRRSFLD